ncbi:MAG: S-methyl-5'-thioadenosine phosphorylase [Endomicrobia bacterium]|nr:S-methyl-5'-thioadenosine phosphorylase [Endomicrobiia bacterium]MDW8055276.1 S-methyl-5'-thioadenosine phosphorylase [Elusimicrobiota bacterium]
MVAKQKLPTDVKIGIIGGSGVYNIEGLSDISAHEIQTPFGKPSDKIIVGKLQGKKVAFLPRHGKGHTILPTEINVHANIYAMKLLGVEFLISISACGSLREEIHPRDFVLPDQIYDRTKFRRQTFFGNGIACHISFSQPYCENLRRLVYDCCKELGVKVHYGGTYVCIEGPQFSTKAESKVYRQLGFDIIGMTALPEAKLAREAEMCYVTIALVTDYDVWKEDKEVTIDEVLENMKANTQNCKKLLSLIISKIDINNRNCICKDALKYAIVTKKEFINKATYKKLRLLLKKYFEEGKK